MTTDPQIIKSQTTHTNGNDLAHWPADTRIELPTESIGDTLRKRVANFGDRPAVYNIVDAENDVVECLTYRELLERSENCARWLSTQTSPGDRVALWSQNTLESVILQYACALSGTILTPFNTAWARPEVEHAVALTTPAVLFFGKDHAGRDLGERVTETFTGSLFSLAQISDVSAQTFGIELPKVAQSDPCLIQFTSGTTGKAKGALLSHRACLIGGWLRPFTEGATENDVWVNGVPFHHIGGSVAVILGALGVGGSFTVLERYDREQLVRLMKKLKATRMGGVPTMWHDILSSPNLPEKSTLRSVSLGGASVSEELARGIYDRLGARCGIGYGQSEFPIISATMPDDPIELACKTVGKPLPHTEMKIIDPETGRTVQYGENGEICLRGPACMDGYWSNPKATAETIDCEGFLHTGDIGSLDVEGYCRIKGRLREMIIRGGENVYPAEIEGALLTHSAVAMAAVVGVEDPRLGQDVGAVITVKPDQTVDSRDLEEHVSKLVAGFKVPKHWRFIEAMPMTASGKIRKVELEKLFQP